MIISIDVDNTLADFNGAYQKLLNSHLAEDQQILHAHPPTYWFDRQPHLQEAVEKAAQAKTKGWWRALDPVPGVDDFLLWKSFELLHSLYFLTHRPVKLKEVTAAWIEEELGVRFPTVVCTLVDKARVATLLDVDVHIDDDPSQVLPLINAGIFTVLIEYPYNAELREQLPPDPAAWISVPTAAEALRVVHRMGKPR